MIYCLIRVKVLPHGSIAAMGDNWEASWQQAREWASMMARYYEARGFFTETVLTESSTAVGLSPTAVPTRNNTMDSQHTPLPV